MAESFFGITDTGKQRTNNEDSFLAEEAADGKNILVCVIDGVGGYAGGEIAAALARDAVHELLYPASGDAGNLVRQACMNANDRIYQEKQGNAELQQMACVLTLVLVEKNANRFLYAHVGDTRLYLFRDGSLVKVTRDHSFVGLLEDSGRINEREAMDHPKRNEIDKALGFHAQLPDPQNYIDTGGSPFLPGDILLLCSDGLTDMVDKETMTSILGSRSPLPEMAAALVAKANENGGRDNITVLLVKNNRDPIPATPVGAPRKAASSNVEAENQKNIKEPETKVRKNEPRKKRTFLPLLLLIAAVAIGIYLACKWNKPEETVAQEPAVFFPVLLEDTLSRDVDSLLLLPEIFGDSVFVGDTVWLYQDSFYMKGTKNTIILPSMGRSMMQVAPSARSLLFEDLELRDIDIRISSANSGALHFKNVRLRNVRFGIGQPLLISDSVLTGSLQGPGSSIKKEKRP